MTSNEPNDGYPVLLEDWIRRDGLKCLTVKLCGNDPEWDFGRLLKVGLLAVANGVDWLSADFNCAVTNPAYVNADPPCPSEPPPGFEVRPPLRRFFRSALHAIHRSPSLNSSSKLPGLEREHF